MKARLFFWSLTAALAGFLFGFDTIVISGAEKTIQDLWQLSPFAHGLALSAALWGTVIGSMFGGWPAERFGRRQTLLWIGILYFVSAVGSGIAPEFYSFMIARFIGGVGVGISTVAAPMFISEIAPAKYRGRLAGMFQFNIVFGILVAFVSNMLLDKWITVDAWRWMLGVEAIPALLYTIFCFGLPESPRWLIVHADRRDEAMDVLRRCNPDLSEEELTELADEIAATAGEKVRRAPFWTRRLQTPILLAFLIAFFNQLSGINAILYFAPRIFQLAGLEKNAALLNSVGIGLTNLIFTFVGLYLIDRLGRRTLLYIGSFGYILSLGICAATFFAYAPQFDVASKAIAVKELCEKVDQAKDDEKESQVEKLDEAMVALSKASQAEGYQGEIITFPVRDTDAIKATTDKTIALVGNEIGSGGTLVLICIFAFIAAHAVGQGAVIWVFIGEIFPNRNRAAGQALGSATHWIFAALLTFAFPKMITAFPPGYIFAFFSFMMVLQLIWVKTMVPETKGVPLEQIQEKLGIK